MWFFTRHKHVLEYGETWDQAAAYRGRWHRVYGNQCKACGTFWCLGSLNGSRHDMTPEEHAEARRTWAVRDPGWSLDPAGRCY